MRRRSRMMIALFAVAIGATILSGLVTIYYDVPRQMGKEFRSYGANLMLTSRGTSDIQEEDLDTLRALIPARQLVGLTSYRYESVRLNKFPFMAGGVDFDSVLKTRPYWGISGRIPSSENEILVGQTVKDFLALKEGDEILLTGTDVFGKEFSETFSVSGILQTGGAEEECVFLSQKKLDLLMDSSGAYDVAECSVSLNADELERLCFIIEENCKNIAPRLVKQVTHSEGTVLAKLQALVWIVTLVVLVLTMVCVATTMMAVVAERRKEIGLKKSLGASNQSIVVDFLGEGLVLGALGGLLGVVLGFVFAQGVSQNVFGSAVSFQWLLAPITILVSVCVTGLACLLPVKSATDVDPALVLKGE